MKLKEVLDKSIQFFKDKKIDSPRLSAELLIADALKLDRMQLYLKYESPLTEDEVAKCRDYIKRHSQGEPVAYITGNKGFFGDIYNVGAGVLIPRPETEGLVEEALKWINQTKPIKLSILDLGAGSGCIGFSILKQCLKNKNQNFEEIKLTSVEKSKEAFKYLAENSKKLELESKATLVNDDVLNYLKNQNDLFDIIVSNPPYIDPNDVRVEKHVKEYEPNEALFANDQGLNCLKTWSSSALFKLKPSAILLLEMGCDQGQAMKNYLESKQNFKNVDIIKDLSGLDRIIKAIT